MQKIYNKLVLFLTVGIILTNLTKVNAQSEPMFSQYTFNEIFINPAYAGSHEAISLSSVYRKQWANIEGAPTTKTFTAHTPFFSDKVGLGLTVYQDAIGVATQTGYFANYAFRIKMRKGTLSMGMLAGFNGYQERLSEIKTNQTGDSRFANNTPTVYAPNFGFGTYYYTKRFYLGLSAPRLISNKLNIGPNGEVQSVDGAFVKSELHYFLATGFVFDINPLFKLRPSMMLKTVINAPIEYDVNLMALMYNSLWLGGGYRSGDSWNLLTALQINNQLRVGYSYDYTITKLKEYAGFTHELSVNYVFKYKAKKLTSPRYF